MDHRGIEDILKDIDRRVREAYQRGYADGRDDMQARILRAAREGIETTHPFVSPVERRTFANNEVSAVAPALGMPPPFEGLSPPVPKGTVRPLVKAILSEQPGLSTAEVGRLAVGKNPHVSPAAVANELNRNIDKLYRRDGRRWFLLNDGEKERGPTTVVAEPHMNGATGESQSVAAGS